MSDTYNSMQYLLVSRFLAGDISIFFVEINLPPIFSIVLIEAILDGSQVIMVELIFNFFIKGNSSLQLLAA